MSNSGRGLYLTDMLINILVMQMLDTAFAALADPTRRAILARLALGEATVGELASPFPSPAPPSRATSRCWRKPR